MLDILRLVYTILKQLISENFAQLSCSVKKQLHRDPVIAHIMLCVYFPSLNYIFKKKLLYSI